MTEALDALAVEAETEEQQAEQESIAIEAALQGDEASNLQAEAEEAAARQGAVMAVSMAETFIKMKYDFLVLQPDIKGQIIDKATPVIRKYNGGLPAWLQPYQKEIELGMVLAAAGFGLYMQVSAHNKAQEAKEKSEQTAGQGAGYAVSTEES